MQMSPADTTLFYFLSTVAQAFAAGFGVLAAFAAFRIAILRQSMRESFGILKERLQQHAQSSRMSIAGTVEEREAELEACLAALRPVLLGKLQDAVNLGCALLGRHPESNKPAVYADIQIAIARLENAMAAERTLKRATLVALFFTTATMVVSLVCLPLTVTLASCRGWEVTTFIVVGVLCAATLFALGNVVVKSLASD